MSTEETDNKSLAEDSDQTPSDQAPSDQASGPKQTETEQTTKEAAPATTYSSQKSDAPIGYAPVEVNLKELLRVGSHYGHQIHRWNPKMLPYIFGVRNGVHIINLDKTLPLWKKAEKFLEDIGKRGGSILLVGTKQQARNIVRDAAERAELFSVTQRWLGGTLSNFETIKRSIARIRKLEELLAEADSVDSKVKLKKKERLSITRELDKLESNLGGIRHMKRLPDAIFIVDINKESIAVAEARKLHIPVIALVDTNVDPTLIDYPIPSNDDSAKTIHLFVNAVADAHARGKESFIQRGPDDTSEVEIKDTHKKKKGKRQETKITESPEDAEVVASSAL